MLPPFGRIIKSIQADLSLKTSDKPAHTGENFRARISSICPYSLSVSRPRACRSPIMESATRYFIPRSNCSFVSIAPMIITSIPHRKIAGSAAVFLFSDRVKHLSALAASSLNRIPCHISMCMPPGQTAGIRTEPLRLPVRMPNHSFSALQAFCFARIRSCLLLVRNDIVSSAKGLYCIG